MFTFAGGVELKGEPGYNPICVCTSRVAYFTEDRPFPRNGNCSVLINTVKCAGMSRAVGPHPRSLLHRLRLVSLFLSAPLRPTRHGIKGNPAPAAKRITRYLDIPVWECTRCRSDCSFSALSVCFSSCGTYPTYAPQYLTSVVQKIPTLLTKWVPNHLEVKLKSIF